MGFYHKFSIQDNYLWISVEFDRYVNTFLIHMQIYWSIYSIDLFCKSIIFYLTHICREKYCNINVLTCIVNIQYIHIHTHIHTYTYTHIHIHILYHCKSVVHLMYHMLHHIHTKLPKSWKIPSFLEQYDMLFHI